jgi:hypothetical protein
MTFNLNDIINQAATESADMSEASKGGGGATPPNAGVCIGTLVGYIELGRRLKKGYKGGADKKVRRARWIFELAGGSNPHTVTEEGAKIAKRVTVNTWLPEPGKQPSSKSAFYKLFSLLNTDKQAKIPAQLLGKHFKLNISVEEFTNDAGELIKYGSIGNAEDGFRVSPASIEITDPDTGMPTGEVRLIPAPEVISAQRCFLWDYANQQMWDSLFIDGEYEAQEAKDGKPAKPAKSKNVIQLDIKEALDWVGSPMQVILAAGGELDVAEVADKTTPAQGAASADALDGLL